MTNGTNGTVLQNDIVRTVAEEYGWPDFRPAVHRISHAGSRDDSVIVGTYQLSRYTAMKVMQEGERLFVQRSGQGRLEMLPEGHDRYFLRDVDCQFTFDFDPAGRATGFTSLQNGQIELAKAITESQSEAVTISLAQKLHDKKADPRSESALRRYIEELRAASVDYGRLSAAAAQMTRARQSEFTTMIVDLGKVQSISFEGVAPNGADIFHIQFENGAMRWQIVPTENGNVDQLGFTFMIKSVG